MLDRESIFNLLLERDKEDWFLFENEFYKISPLVKELLDEIDSFKSENRIVPNIFLVETNPLKFIAYFLSGIISGANIFLGDSHWQSKEWLEVMELVRPDIIWGINLKEYLDNFQDLRNKRKSDRINNCICIPTGGSSGKIRFVIHNIKTLSASVKAFGEYFVIDRINCYCILPLYHVSGLMQFWRSFITRGIIVIDDYKKIKKTKRLGIDPQNYFISLVPTQLQYLLDCMRDRLVQFHTVLLGGAPASECLLERARKYKIPVATTYGMSETASGITYLKSSDFLEGNNSSGKILPHAKIKIVNQNDYSKIGEIKIEASCIYLGYYPQIDTKKKYLITDDLGFIDKQGFLYIVGRKSQKIITGGENVFPQEIEASIMGTNLIKDVCVIGVPDPVWGEAVTVLFVPINPELETDLIKTKIQNKLSKYKYPKHWIKLKYIPRSDRHKIDYSKIKNIACSIIDRRSNE